MSNVTRKQAESVLAAVIERFSAQLRGFTIPADEHGPEFVVQGEPESEWPQLVEHYQDWAGGSTRWAIVWEGGDFEWAYRACSGDINEEVASVLHHEFGVERNEAGRRAFESAVTVSDKVHLEPVTSYVVGIFPAF